MQLPLGRSSRAGAMGARAEKGGPSGGVAHMQAQTLHFYGLPFFKLHLVMSVDIHFVFLRAVLLLTYPQALRRDSAALADAPVVQALSHACFTHFLSIVGAA